MQQQAIAERHHPGQCDSDDITTLWLLAVSTTRYVDEGDNAVTCVLKQKTAAELDVVKVVLPWHPKSAASHTKAHF
jgi:hypothetical protein